LEKIRRIKYIKLKNTRSSYAYSKCIYQINMDKTCNQLSLAEGKIINVWEKKSNVNENKKII
jgi:hypothetical protein